MEDMKAIYVIERGDKRVIFVNTDFVKMLNLNTSEINFIHYIVPIQLQKGVDEWLILKLDDLSKKLNTPKATISGWLKKLRETNILLQESFRSTLWKINPHIIEVDKK